MLRLRITSKSLARSIGVTKQLPIMARWNSSKGECSHSRNLNEPVSKEQLKKNEEEYEDFIENKISGKEFVKENYKGFKDLQDKGNKIPEEQDRPEDFMWHVSRVI